MTPSQGHPSQGHNRQYELRPEPQGQNSFARLLIDFYGLKSRAQTTIYYAGLSVRPNDNNSYEHELDGLIREMHSELDNPSALKKIGVTLSPEIAAKRPDIETIVGDLYKLHFDGILFIPRPRNYVKVPCMVDGVLGPLDQLGDYLISFLASLISRATLGLIAFNLEADFNPYATDLIQMRISSELNCYAEVVNTPNRVSKKHILVKHK